MPNTITDTITELADNKSDIQDALVAKGVTLAAGHGFNKFAEDIGTITNRYIQADEGKVVSSGELVAQTSTTAITNGTIDTTTNNQVVVNVPNSYTAGDEGKVVSNGALVAQTAYSSTITENGTYNTTENNSVTVNVPKAPSSINISNALSRVSANINDSDIYLINMEDKTYLIGWIYISTNYPTTSIILSYDSSFIPTHYTNYTQDTYLIYTNTQSTSVTYARCNQQIDLSNRTVSFDLPMPVGKYYISAIFC